MITLLSTADAAKPTLTKTHTWTSDGWSTKPYDRAYLFHATSYEAGSIDDLSALLSAMEAMPDFAIIRGRLTDPERVAHIRRTLHTEAGSPARFEADPHGLPWLMVDFDAIPVGSLGLSTNFARLSHLTSLLPPEFQGVTYHYQWSSSAGLRGWDELSCHVWYWLDQPWPCRTLYERFADGDWAECEVDPAPFTANQLHYTAAPQFIGALDPLGSNRSGLVRRERDVVSVSPWVRHVEPKTAISPVDYERRFPGQRFEQLLSEIGPNYHRPILRAVAHYAAVHADPDENELRERLTDAIWQAVPGRHRKADYLDRRYLDRVIRGAFSKFGGRA